MSGARQQASVIDDAWDSVVGGFHWLKSVLLGEFEDNRPLSAIIADMLVSFIPAVVIATSARDAIAVILRMAKHPEKREEVLEWVLLCACLITIALPIAMAAAGVAAAGVGAVVGGIAGSELGAALRAVMLLLVKASTKLVDVIHFLQKFIRGDILKFLKAIKFAKYEQALLSAVRQFTGKLIEITRGLAKHLESLSYFQYTRTLIAKLKTWERSFYAVQTAAIRKIPLAMAELDARLAKVIAETLPRETHVVPAGVKAPKPKAATPAAQQVRDVPGRILRDVDESAPRGGAKPATGRAAPPPKSTPTPKPPEDKPPLKDKPDEPKKAETGSNVRAQQTRTPDIAAASEPRYKPGFSESDILTIPKGSRPDPRSYLEGEYVDQHLQTFKKEGGAFLFTDADISNPKYTSFNPSKFVMAGSDLDSVVNEFKVSGDSSVLENALGYKPGELAGKDIYMLKLENPNVIMPTGNEGGANSLWRPGGLTYPGGMREAVLDNVPIYHGNDVANLPNVVKIQ